MPPEVIKVALKVIEVVSILYLRCFGHMYKRHRWGMDLVSILYLRCNKTAAATAATWTAFQFSI